MRRNRPNNEANNNPKNGTKNSSNPTGSGGQSASGEFFSSGSEDGEEVDSEADDSDSTVGLTGDQNGSKMQTRRSKEQQQRLQAEERWRPVRAEQPEQQQSERGQRTRILVYHQQQRELILFG